MRKVVYALRWSAWSREVEKVGMKTKGMGSSYVSLASQKAMHDMQHNCSMW